MRKTAISITELPVIDKKSGLPEHAEVFQSGCVIVTDKPAGWTSFDVVKYIRSRIPSKKVGHSGTLDPLATGLLILCAGKATKRISEIQDLPKTYEATIRFGASTPSFDSETDPDQSAEWKHITQGEIEKTISEAFTGTVLQVPPIYSAKRVGGKRLYTYARKGEQVHIEPREVDFHEINILDFSLPELKIRVRCGKGTYIRSLAHDLGKALDSLAHLTGLRRTETGSFHVDNAITPIEFNKLTKEADHG